ncbi:hypothetical protein JW766_03635 [Candidatus Dojkabacteria bacterium]|nr:hypothetical protein [Candidatus Dojkabacteria bacterium]
MELSDVATKDFIFQKDTDRSGIVTCRHCETKVRLILDIQPIFFVLATKVKLLGKWCKCSSIKEIIEILVGESM